MDDGLGTAMIVLMVITGVVVALCMYKLSGISENEWEEANSMCTNGVAKVYLDGNYNCKKGE